MLAQRYDLLLCFFNKYNWAELDNHHVGPHCFQFISKRYVTNLKGMCCMKLDCKCVVM